MQSIPTKKFIKLGTALRFLIDAQAGSQLGGGHILDNIKDVLTLIKEIQFTGSVDSGSYRKLQAIHAELGKASATVTKLDHDQAERLEDICRKLRAALLAEGDNIIAYYLSEKEVDQITSPGWPPITLDLLRKTDWKLIVGFLTLIGCIFSGATSI